MDTKIVKLDPVHPDQHVLKEAAHIISEGGLVIIPTETVYGIAANMLNMQGLSRLYEVKERPKDKPFTVHIDEKIRVEEFATRIPVSAYRLIDKLWPGPLTVILKYKDGGSIGLRLPDNKIAREIISLAKIPVVCPSANISCRPAPKDFQEAIKDLNGLVELAIDGGSCVWARESTIVDFTVEPPQILREGAIKKEDIEAIIRKKNILFVCTGNTCRSVMAEALLKKILKEKNRIDVQVMSAGFLVFSGLGATAGTKEVLRKEGIDVADFRSQRLTREMIKKSDLILVMEKLHEEHVVRIAPEVKNRVFLLREFAKIQDNNLEVADPLGRDSEFYERTLGTIKEALERIVDLI